MAESIDVEDAGNKAIILDSPAVENKENVNLEEEDFHNAKIGLNRSMSCGSILQGNGMGKKLSRRVSFPSDDKLISGYNEPKNPWEHAHETTTEDLIQAYTQACQTWNVRPITKLLLQLQEIRDFSVRANSLTLKGEKLEMRVVETLESIFKRVQFITIDLEATNLDEDAGASLFDMIEYYESAVNVLVGFNKNLGNRGWQAAAHMMRKMSCLRLFDGHSVPLSIQASPFVGRALRLSNTLVTLHLENAMLSGRPILLIVAALRMNTTLRELFLADNRLTPLDALQLANLLKFNRILQLLDMRNNPIQDMGLGHLCAGLMAQTGSAGLNGASGGLQTMVLWNNQISQEGMSKLALALRYTVSLSTLNLGQNVLGDDGILRLKEGLLQNHSLLRLGLVGTKLTDEGAVAIAEYLAESPRIIRLDLRNNDIKVAGLMALSLAFKINHSLLRLDIDKPNKKDALKELAAKQESLMNDIVTYAMRNKQAALEKAQAAQMLQEQMRKGETELRYMDMTNASTSTSDTPSSTISASSATSSTETSANNSNNQSPIMRVKGQEGAEQSSKQTVTTSKSGNTTADDSPENSPEFLPANSVSYHQVSPVMLSNCEMAKRAAAAKLKPVPEQQEGTPPTPRKFITTAVTKLVDDAFSGAKLTLAGQHEPAADSEAQAAESVNLETDSASSGEPEAAAPEANNLTDFSKPDTTAAEPSQSQDIRTAENEKTLDSFAENFTNSVMTSATNPIITTDTSLPTQTNSDTNQSIPFNHGAENVSDTNQNLVTGIDTNATGAEMVSGANQNLVYGIETNRLESTTGAENKPTGAEIALGTNQIMVSGIVTNPTGAQIMNGATKTTPLTTKELNNSNILPSNLKLDIENQSLYEPGAVTPPQEGDSPDKNTNFVHKPEQNNLVVNSKTSDVPQEMSASLASDNDISSGLGTEDNSIISDDLSPMVDKTFADKGSELLTPDSGMVHFEHSSITEQYNSKATAADKIVEPKLDEEVSKPDLAADIASLRLDEGSQPDAEISKPEPGTEISQSNFAANNTSIAEIGKSGPADFDKPEPTAEISQPADIDSEQQEDNTDNQHEIVNSLHEQDHEILSKKSQIIVEKTENGEFNENSPDIVPKSEISENHFDEDPSPCEVEVSHYDLNEFPTE
uniref:protein phosphatase 1 regulatory subunit 37-like isoform X1 n=1 Tax=Styela clava TaxID=7725 RepID=UPI00193A1AD5|nr:protein phosphatase 1 regulatory subunit 37-like isoform X1 [Styela clava]